MGAPAKEHTTVCETQQMKLLVGCCAKEENRTILNVCYTAVKGTDPHLKTETQNQKILPPTLTHSLLSPPATAKGYSSGICFSLLAIKQIH